MRMSNHLLRYLTNEGIMKNKRFPWNTEHIAFILDLHDNGKKPTEISDAMTEKYNLKEKLNPDTIRNHIRRLTKKNKEQPLKVEFPDKLESLNMEETIDSFIAAQDIARKFNIGEYMASIKLNVDHPIAVSFVSDVHLGSPATDYEALKDDLNLIDSDERLFLMAGGDWEDSFMTSFKDAGAVFGQIQPPSTQFKASSNILKHLCDRNKLLAKCAGNHDSMLTRISGVDMNYWILQGEQPPYFPYGGLVKLFVGKAEYKILWKHKWRYNSTLNQFNAHHRAYEMLYPDSDIVIMEHEHNPGIETIERGEFDMKKSIINIRTGSYKGGDAFSRKFYKDGRRGAQTVVFFPDKKYMAPMHGTKAIRDAIYYMDGENKCNI